MLHVSVISIRVTDAGSGLTLRFGYLYRRVGSGPGSKACCVSGQNICMVDGCQVLDIVWPSLIKEKIPKTPRIPKTYEHGNVPIVPVPYAWRFSNEGIVLCASHDRFSRRDAQTTTPISLYLPKKTAHPRRPPLRPSQCKQNVQLMYHATTELPPPTNALPNTSKVKSLISLIIHRNYIHTPLPPNRRPFPTQAKGPKPPLSYIHTAPELPPQTCPYHT